MLLPNPRESYQRNARTAFTLALAGGAFGLWLATEGGFTSFASVVKFVLGLSVALGSAYGFVRYIRTI